MRRVEEVRVLPRDARTSRARPTGGSRGGRVRRSSRARPTGSRKRSSRLTTVVLPAPLGPTSATLPSGLEPEAHVREHRLVRVAGRDAAPARSTGPRSGPAAAAPDRERQARDRSARARAARRSASPRARARPAGALRLPRTTRARAAPARRSARGRACPRRGRPPTRRGRRRSWRRRRRATASPRPRRRSRRAARAARARRSARADALRGLLLAAVGDELGRAAQELDELRRQLGASSRAPQTGRAAEPAREPRHRDAAGEETGGEDERRRRAGTPRSTPTQTAPVDDGDERRAEPAEVEALQGVDVADHPVEQLAVPVALELRGRERLDALVEARAHARQRAQREIVRREALEVAGERPREPEEAHGHDRRRRARGSPAARPRARSGSPPWSSGRRRR